MPVCVDKLVLDPPVFLAPMAGISDLPFRTLVSGFGAGLVVSEMIASQEFLQARSSALARAELGLDADNTSVQIAGCEAHWLAECARLCEAQGARIIDFNMGCPAKKVTNGYSGSALMRDPDNALRLIEAVVGAVDVPVTLKMRLGWDENNLNAPEIAKRAENAGVSMITVHGRTRKQFYKGSADWRAIKDVKNAVRVPVIANGDIVDVSSARAALEQSGADGIMIGRGIQGKPWLLATIASEIFGSAPPQIPTGSALSDMIIRHYEHMLDFYGAEVGLKCARKHLGWYLQNFQTTDEVRKKLLTAKSPANVVAILRDIGTIEPAKVAA